MAVPKHIFISWMEILNRLPTMDKLTSWGLEVRELCGFCQTEMETRDHIFLAATTLGPYGSRFCCCVEYEENLAIGRKN